MVKCAKKSESVTHIHMYGSQKVVKNLSFSSNSQSVSISTTSVAQFVPQRPLPPERLWKMTLPNVLHCRFVQRLAKQI
jgi:hypothetical protein